MSSYRRKEEVRHDAARHSVEHKVTLTVEEELAFEVEFARAPLQHFLRATSSWVSHQEQLRRPCAETGRSRGTGRAVKICVHSAKEVHVEQSGCVGSLDNVCVLIVDGQTAAKRGSAVTQAQNFGEDDGRLK
jgi:ribosomal protein S14